MHEPPKEPVKYVEANLYLPYHYVAGDYRARYLRALKDKKILGSKCSKTGKVFVRRWSTRRRASRRATSSSRSPTAASSRPSASSTSR